MKDSIKAGELRLNNWVEHIEKGYCQVLRIADDELLDSVNSIERSLSQYEPIPLSKEVLEKCGFVKSYLSGYTYWSVEDALWSIRDKNDTSYQFALIVRFNEIWKFDNEIKHLHQLMNLFYSLTGKELEITL